MRASASKPLERQLSWKVALNWIYMQVFSAGDVRLSVRIADSVLLDSLEAATRARLDMTGKKDRKLLRYVVFSRSLVYLR